jgi:hypothetical protein
MPADGHRDYSGTPLWRKLGIGPRSRVHLVGAPDDLRTALVAIAPLPEGVRFLSRPAPDLDVIVLFVTRTDELLARFDRLTEAIAVDGRLWIAWPKKAAKVPTDVTFDLVQSTGLTAGLVDNKSAAITPAYQGLQFVRRRADRPAGAR